MAQKRRGHVRIYVDAPQLETGPVALPSRVLCEWGESLRCRPEAPPSSDVTRSPRNMLHNEASLRAFHAALLPHNHAMQKRVSYNAQPLRAARHRSRSTRACTWKPFTTWSGRSAATRRRSTAAAYWATSSVACAPVPFVLGRAQLLRRAAATHTPPPRRCCAEMRLQLPYLRPPLLVHVAPLPLKRKKQRHA